MTGQRSTGQEEERMDTVGGIIYRPATPELNAVSMAKRPAEGLASVSRRLCQR